MVANDGDRKTRRSDRTVGRLAVSMNVAVQHCRVIALGQVCGASHRTPADAAMKKPGSAGLFNSCRPLPQLTSPIAFTTASMLPWFSAATQMRPESTP